ncbi:hypothetical protein ABWK33_20160 [Bacillus wiedmannii]|uniref:hypothetical protein n=1 Tax=Bacillus wiedmannii TaxID=1890302 RepID=UPI000BEFDDE7|nr:hypothetical protein [Bacillus wiedmannii]PEJ38090.1 hypothetical protein CN889_22585 [Bacillus wiedmannii]
MVNRVQNGGFEQSTTNSTDPGPFWTGEDVSVESGNQLLGVRNIDLLQPSSFISQQLLPLVVGQFYTFKFAVANGNSSNGGGTLDVDITGNPTRSFDTDNITNNPFIYYNFDFTAINTNTILTITNNSSNFNIRLDEISVNLA